MKLTLVRANYADPVHARGLLDLLDHYARGVEGGGEALAAPVRVQLPAALAARPFVFSVLAFDGDTPVGLANAIEGFSTFACAPLVNLHDIVVRDTHRRRGIGTALIAAVEAEARARGAVKLTLEVLDGNASARRLYETLGFADYQLDPAMGRAGFMQKWLG